MLVVCCGWRYSVRPMAKARSILLVRYEEPTEEGELPEFLPLGTAGELRDSLAPYNCRPDGDPASRTTLYGPGVTLSFPMVGDEEVVQQILLTIVEESIAWPVIMRLCRAMQWRMMDAG